MNAELGLTTPRLPWICNGSSSHSKASAAGHLCELECFFEPQSLAFHQVGYDNGAGAAYTSVAVYEHISPRPPLHCESDKHNH